MPHLLGFWISMKDIVSMLDCRCRVSSCTLDTGESQPDIKICRDFEFLYFSRFVLFYSFPTLYFPVRTCMLCRQNGRQTQHQQPIMQRSVAMQTARPLSSVSVLVSTSLLQWGHCRWQALTQTVHVIDKSLTLTFICFIDTHRHLQ